MIQTEGIFVGGGAISAPIIGEDFNWSGGDGTYQVLDDGGGNWRIKFLSSGTFTPLKNMVIDAFLVGAGGGKGSVRCGGGGAGYTTTVRSITLAAIKSQSAQLGRTAVREVAHPLQMVQMAAQRRHSVQWRWEEKALQPVGERAVLAVPEMVALAAAAIITAEFTPPAVPLPVVRMAVMVRQPTPLVAKGRALPPVSSAKRTATCTLPAAAIT